METLQPLVTAALAAPTMSMSAVNAIVPHVATAEGMQRLVQCLGAELTAVDEVRRDLVQQPPRSRPPGVDADVTVGGELQHPSGQAIVSSTACGQARGHRSCKTALGRPSCPETEGEAGRGDGEDSNKGA